MSINNNININTNFQNGDNNVHIGPQERKLDSQIEEQLKKMIPRDATVDITSVLGNSEAYNFAYQIKIFLEKVGYKVSGVNQAIYTGPVNGQILEQPKNGDNVYRLIIGNNQS